MATNTYTIIVEPTIERLETAEISLLNVSALGMKYDDTLTQFGVTTTQEAIETLWAYLVADQDDFANPYNSGLGLILGAY